MDAHEISIQYYIIDSRKIHIWPQQCYKRKKTKQKRKLQMDWPGEMPYWKIVQMYSIVHDTSYRQVNDRFYPVHRNSQVKFRIRRKKKKKRISITQIINLLRVRSMNR